MNQDLDSIILHITFLFIALGLFILFFILLFTRKKNKLIMQNQLLEAEHKQQLLQTQIEIQEQTLKTISQEIHDNIGQVLSLAKLNLNTFQNIESASNQTKITDTKLLISKAINDLRDLSRSLHGDKIAELGLQESITNELKILENTGQYKTQLQVLGSIYKLEPQKEMVLFRMVQEALNNIVKHAKAKNITISINYISDLYTLTIEDDGIGFNEAKLDNTKTGIGLKSMQNRAVLIGGNFKISTIQNIGTKIMIDLKK